MPGESRHLTSIEAYQGRRFRWHCSCGRTGPKWYQIRGLAAVAGETHERAMNANIKGETHR